MSNNNNNPPSFLTKLTTLNDFVTGMGIKTSESTLSETLKASGHNVEVALERILLSGKVSNLSSSSDAPASQSASISSSNKKRGSVSSSSSAKKKKTPKSNIKRQKLGAPTSSICKANSHAPSSSTNDNNSRLLLCKRWTVACSKSIRGRVNYGEILDFSENWSNGHNINSHTPSKKKGGPMDPMVRFRCKSGMVEGILNKYLCSILVPLLHLPATNNGTNNSKDFIPLISIEGEALMEDTSLVIGSEVPINLKIFINDPIGFFSLFSTNGEGEESSSSSKLFFQNTTAKKGGSGSSKMPSYQGKKAKSSFTNEELSEAAFHLLQWAEKGEELPFKAKEKEVGPMKGEEEEKEEEHDVDREENKSQEVDELNEMVALNDGKPAKVLLPELADPTGFKSGVTLRPYQAQALHWMCRREGVHIEGEMSKDGINGGSEELDFLAELATSNYNSSANMDLDIQVWGGKAISCDCGPVVVNDATVALKAMPVAEYGQKRNGNNETTSYIHHPLWKRRFLATDDLGSVFSFYVNELLGIASAKAPDPPKQAVGGILADAMGLGKTVMLLSLILKTKENDADGGSAASTKKRVGEGNLKSEERATKRKAVAAPKEDVDVVDLSFDNEHDSDCQMDDDDESYTDDHASMKSTKKPLIRRTNSNGTTLVVAPLSLISQWEEELASKTDLSHLVYYDNNKRATGGDAFLCCDVVVTTYGTLQSEYLSLARSSSGTMQPGQSHPLLQFNWKRVILDEAHGIKNPNTQQSKACCLLKADTRWCVTGTPIQNSLQDVYGLLKFLRHEPWNDAWFWRSAITNSVSGGVGNASTDESDHDAKDAAQLLSSVAFARVRRVLSPLILRRTKDTLSEDGTPILNLPPIDHQIVNVSLSPPEREFYNALLERSQTVFEGFIKNGTASKSWFAIFSLLQRLRQACDHVSLTVNKKMETSEAAKSKLGNESARAESLSSDDVEDSIDGNFLTGILNKFKKKKSTETTTSTKYEPSFAQKVAESLSQVHSGDEYLKIECPICLDEPRVEDAVHTPCAHMFCRTCLLSEFQEQINRSNKPVQPDMLKKADASKEPKVEGGSCPVCHDYVKISQIIQIEKDSNGEMKSKYLKQQRPQLEKENSTNTNETQLRDALARQTLKSALNGATSSKLEAVVAELDNVWKMDPCSKVLIFSQYLGYLDIIGGRMKDNGIECFRIDGSLSLKERVSMIGRFNKHKSSPAKQEDDGSIQRGSVFLVSMKAGGVGLNLVAASSVFILDPWWNQAVEDQCINRIHRIGQQAEVVRVRKFVVTDSVEEKIANLQEKKKGMANTILEADGDDGQLDSTKPTLDDFKMIFGR